MDDRSLRLAYSLGNSTAALVEGADPHTAGLVEVARQVEAETIARASDEGTALGLASEQVRQLTRIANAMNSSPDMPTLHADRVLEAWEATGMRMHEDKAIALLERLGFKVEQPERTTRVV